MFPLAGVARIPGGSPCWGDFGTDDPFEEIDEVYRLLVTGVCPPDSNAGSELELLVLSRSLPSVDSFSRG